MSAMFEDVVFWTSSSRFSIWGTLVLHFQNDQTAVLAFSDPFIFADDLKTLSVQKEYWEIQDDYLSIEMWVEGNKMVLDPKK